MSLTKHCKLSRKEFKAIYKRFGQHLVEFLRLDKSEKGATLVDPPNSCKLSTYQGLQKMRDRYSRERAVRSFFRINEPRWWVGGLVLNDLVSGHTVNSGTISAEPVNPIVYKNSLEQIEKKNAERRAAVESEQRDIYYRLGGVTSYGLA